VQGELVLCAPVPLFWLTPRAKLHYTAWALPFVRGSNGDSLAIRSKNKAWRCRSAPGSWGSDSEVGAVKTAKAKVRSSANRPNTVRSWRGLAKRQKSETATAPREKASLNSAELTIFALIRWAASKIGRPLAWLRIIFHVPELRSDAQRQSAKPKVQWSSYVDPLFQNE
jgi:hypothetical protein